MSTPAFSLVRDGSRLTRITYAGRLREADLLAFDTELRVQLSATPEHSLDFVIDLGAVTDFCHDGRDILVRIHQFVVTRARSTIFVANQPATRGLALWMMHMGGDRSAWIVPTLDAALRGAESSMASSAPPPIQSQIREILPEATAHKIAG